MFGALSHVGLVPLVALVPLEILHRALVLRGGGSGFEGTEISTMFGLRIDFPRVQTILTRTEFADHEPLNSQSIFKVPRLSPICSHRCRTSLREDAGYIPE
jgi:hypothetical protein